MGFAGNERKSGELLIIFISDYTTITSDYISILNMCVGSSCSFNAS